MARRPHSSLVQFLCLFVRVVGAADERAGFDVANPHAFAFLFEGGKFLRSVEARHGQLLA